MTNAVNGASVLPVIDGNNNYLPGAPAEFATNVVRFPGDQDWFNAYEWGDALEAQFSNQEARNFAYAVEYNDRGPLSTENGIADLTCLHVGENDGESWIWMVSLQDDTHWRVTGWCDYTGWDCQSGVEWTKVDDGLLHT